MTIDIKSLQELSFEKIIKHFSQYTAAHALTKNEILMKNLCFLQRVYTHTLFFELEQNKELKEEHFGFLLNKSLKKLDLGTLLSCSSKENILEKVLPIASSLHELSWGYDFRHAEDSTFIFSKLIPLSRHVNKIDIPFIGSDDLLKLIGASCTSLVELNIENSENVTGDGVKALCLNPDGEIQMKCPLKHLNLMHVENVSVEDVAFLLRNLPTLEEVIYSKLPNAVESIHLLDADNNIEPSHKQFKLQSLDLIPYEDPLEVSKLLTLCVERCPRIKKLSVPIANAEDLEWVGRFSSLENLTVVCYDVMDLNSFLGKKGNNLKVLTIDSFSLSMSTLVENCPNLETLTLKTVQYQGVEDTTKVMNRLKSVQLESVIFLDYHCTDNVMMLLNSSPNLESLSLLYCDFSDSDIIAKLSTFSLTCNLSHLHFDFSDIGVDLLQQFILNCNSIKSLSLDNCDNISLDDIGMLNQTIEASNRKILINFTDSESDIFTGDSDYDIDYDADENDYDIDDYHGFELYDEYDEYDDYDDYVDYENGIHPDFW